MNYPNYFYQNQQMNQPPAPMQNGFMVVRTEQEARNYPVAPGNVITFKIENQPIVCEKAQGFSQLEGPVFHKYRLIKADEQEEVVDEPDFRAELNALKAEVKEIKERLRPKKEGKNE